LPIFSHLDTNCVCAFVERTSLEKQWKFSDEQSSAFKCEYKNYFEQPKKHLALYFKMRVRVFFWVPMCVCVRDGLIFGVHTQKIISKFKVSKLATHTHNGKRNKIKQEKRIETRSAPRTRALTQSSKDLSTQTHSWSDCSLDCSLCVLN